MGHLDAERKAALQVVLKACKACLDVQKNLVDHYEVSEETITKKDQSPVTVGDYTVQALVIHELSKAFPDYPFIAEEDSQTLAAQADVKSSVLKFVQEYHPEVTEETVLSALAKGSNEKTSSKRWWTLDPIDGTLGFLRRDQYAVALALMEDNKPILGILGCPALPIKTSEPSGPTGCILIAVKGEGAFMRSLDSDVETRLHVSAQNNPALAVFTESFVSRGFAGELNASIAKTLGVSAAPLKIDSQCKYAMVARGDSDVYLRLSSLEYREMIWDHAAGVIVVEEAGGKVVDFRGNELDFSAGRRLENNVGIVCTNSVLHNNLMEAIDKVGVVKGK